MDIITRLNPYVRSDPVAPSNTRKYVKRSSNVPSMIHVGCAVVRASKQRSLGGGKWKNVKTIYILKVTEKNQDYTYNNLSNATGVERTKAQAVEE